MGRAFSLSIDLADLLSVGPIASAGVFAQLQRQVRLTVETGEARWREAVERVPGLWSGERDAYAASISSRMTAEYAGEIASNYKYVEDIESGRPAYDMKRMLNTSLKTRVSKKGVRYLIIPMRHNTPGNSAHRAPMPESVHQLAKSMKASKVTANGSRANQLGAHSPATRALARVGARRYAWGDRLAKTYGPHLGANHGPGRAAPPANRFDGMVRMDTSAGGKTYSSYMTFRVMTEKSPGWIIPAKPGVWIAKNVSDSLARSAAKDFPAALARDLA